MNIKLDYNRPWQRTIGNVCLTVKLEIDEDPDLSWLGEYSQYREPAHASEKLVHRASQTVLDHKGIWRDKLGRIAPVPKENPYAREYEYTWHNNGHDRGIYALRDSEYMDRIDDGDIGVYGIVATVDMHGKNLGYESYWGYHVRPYGDLFKDDMKYIGSEASWILREAISAARDYIAKLCASATDQRRQGN